MEITRRSAISGVVRTKDLDVTEEQMALWESPNRPLIQHAFPNLTAGEREFILTGITEEEWDELYPEDEDDAEIDEQPF